MLGITVFLTAAVFCSASVNVENELKEIYSHSPGDGNTRA